MVAEHAAGDLLPPALGLLIGHLASCSGCASRLRSEVAFVSRLRQATDASMTDDARARLRELLASIGDPKP
jgi:hypothetical protein